MKTSTNIVTHDEWTKARKELLIKEKEFVRLRDELGQQIRDLPSEEVDRDYSFEGPDGPTTLAKLFGPNSQLIVYHFMFGPDWEEGCKECSLVLDNIAPSAIHLRARDVSFAVVSRAPLEKVAALRERIEWDVHWVSSFESEFNEDFQVSVSKKLLEAGEYEHNYEPKSVAALEPNTAPKELEFPGLSVFCKDAEGRILHTYSSYGRGVETFMSIYRLLDIVPKGRDEDELDYGMAWVRHRDKYPEQPGSKSKACH